MKLSKMIASSFLSACIFLMAFPLIAQAEPRKTVTLDLGKGPLYISCNYYYQEGMWHDFDGDYILTGTILDPAPIRICNTSSADATFNITLNNLTCRAQGYSAPIAFESTSLNFEYTVNFFITGTNIIEGNGPVLNSSQSRLTFDGSKGNLTIISRLPGQTIFTPDSRLSLLNASACSAVTINNAPATLENGKEVNSSIKLSFDHDYTHNDSTHTCSKCHQSFPHHFFITNVDEATHTQTCTDCGYSKAVPHSIDKAKKVTVEPTCQTEGYTDYLCPDCQYLFKRADIKPKVDHKFGYCYAIDDINHIYECEYGCGNTLTEKHTLRETVVEPSVSARGYTETHCTKCDYIYRHHFTGVPRCLYVLLDDEWYGGFVEAYLNGKRTDIYPYMETGFCVGPKDSFVMVYREGQENEYSQMILYDDQGNRLMDESMKDHMDGDLLFKQNVADYTDVKKAISEIPSDLSVYTLQSVNNLLTAKQKVIPYLGDQKTVDGFASAIREGIRGLVRETGSTAGRLLLGSGDILITKTGYSIGEAAETAYTGAYYLFGSAQDTAITVASGTHSLSVYNVDVTAAAPGSPSSAPRSPLTIKSGAVVHLTAIGDNYFTATTAKADSDTNCGAGIYVPVGATFTVTKDSTGCLTASSHGPSAGIGGSFVQEITDDETAARAATVNSAGNIIFDGGTVSAYGSYFSAGIGSAENGIAGNITVNRGTIRATAANDGAGIGCGDLSTLTEYLPLSSAQNQVKIVINGGSVMALSQYDGAGIGGGYGAGAGDITINGGTIRTYSQEDGAGIGCGDCNEEAGGGSVVINGGTIWAGSADDGAGIGGGDYGAIGSVTVNGGYITVYSYDGTGIGGGDDSPAGKITLNSGTIRVADYHINIVGNGFDCESPASETNFVEINEANLYSNAPEQIAPAPKNADGTAVFPKTILLPDTLAGKKVYLSMPGGETWYVTPVDKTIILYLPRNTDLSKIDPQELKDADYTGVDRAIASVPKDLSKFTADSVDALNKAVKSVVRDLQSDKQSDVDAMAKAIEDAVHGLTLLKADYTKLDQAIAKIPQDLRRYTPDSVATLKQALHAVVRDLSRDKQSEVDAMTAAVEKAIKALIPISSPHTGEAANNTRSLLLLLSGGAVLTLTGFPMRTKSAKKS